MTLNSPHTPASLRAHGEALRRDAAEILGRAKDYEDLAARLEAELAAHAGQPPASPLEQQAQAAVNGGHDTPEKPS